MKLLGLDIETGASFDNGIKDNFITEIGMVLWDTEYDMPVVIENKIIKNLKPISSDAEIYTGITNNITNKYGTKIEYIDEIIYGLSGKSDYIVAHNGNKFDKPIIENNFIDFPKKTWIDTMIDIDYPSNCMHRNLTYLAGFHLLLNPFPHRAVTDVLTMLSILAKYDLDDIIKSSESPMVIICAKVSFDEKDDAKKAGFHWNGATKKWIKEIRISKFEELKKSLSFDIKIIK